MILADTSVWIDHLRKTDSHLSACLEENSVLCHPFVIGELACGNLRNRTQILALLAALPSSSVATDDEVLFLVSNRGLSGKGLGWIDVHLLAAVHLSGSMLWTRDKALAAAAMSLKVCYD